MHIRLRHLLTLTVATAYAVIASVCACSAATRPAKLTIDYRTHALGIDTRRPVMGWLTESTRRGVRQTAYEIFVAASPQALASGPYTWDSGKIASDASAGISYGGAELAPETRYYWKVRAWYAGGDCAESRGNDWFETGLLSPSLTAWEGAKWLMLPHPAPPQHAQTKYSIESDFLISTEKGSDDHARYTAGFAFGYSESDAASYYIMIAATPQSREAEVYWNRCNRYGYVSFGQSLKLGNKLDASRLFAGKFHLKAAFDGPTVRLYLDSTLIWTTKIDQTRDINCAAGYYNERTSHMLYTDNFCIKDSLGRTLCSEDFSSATATVFGPQVVERRNVGGEYMGLVNGMPLLVSTKYASRTTPAPLFRKEFKLKGKVKRARLYATAAGSYIFYINGRRVGDSYLAPGNFNPNHGFQYQTYDVTSMLSGTDNAIGAVLGHGWYDRAGSATCTGSSYGNYLALLGKLVITYENGERCVIPTDSTWQAWGDGPVRNDDLWQGEWYDAAKEPEGWNSAGFNAEGWGHATECMPWGDGAKAPITAQADPPVRCVATLKPCKVNRLADGRLVYDFGQEFTGFCRVKVKGSRGAAITMRHGEWLNSEKMGFKDGPDGSVWTRNLLGAQSSDRYILKGGDAAETFTPELTYHAFRYMDLAVDGNADVISVEGIAISSACDTTGHFSCSDSLVNKLYSNIWWSQTDNFISVPVDCPQRTERFGWTGDAQIFSSTAAYNSNVRNFYYGYVDDILQSQLDDGQVYDMAPFAGPCGSGNNGWGDAVVIIPWNMYVQYGDTAILRKAYTGMKRWTLWLAAHSDNWLRGNEGYGDHLALDSNAKPCINTAWCARVCSIMSRAAKVLGNADDAIRFAEYFENYRRAWVKAWVKSDGNTLYRSQAPIALGIAFGLYPDSLRAPAARLLANKLDTEGIMTGFAGTGYVLPALSATGNGEAAARAITRRDYPSWLWCVEKGATTVWESFRGFHENGDGTYDIWGSLNHYSFGSVARWLYACAAGIQPDEERPGFKHFMLRPCINGSMAHAEASYESVYGKIESAWRKSGKRVTYHAVVPPNTSATLTLPGKGWRSPDAKAASSATNSTTYELSSGKYKFSRDIAIDK